MGVDLPEAGALNRQLHGERLWPGTHRRRFHVLDWEDLPDGVFVLLDGRPAVIVDDHVSEWTHGGYGAKRARPHTGRATVITPPSSVAALRAGYPVQIDDSAG